MSDNNLIKKIIEASNYINSINFKSSGNYILANKDVSDIFINIYKKQNRIYKIKKIYGS
mgnify:CR=1 FL=1